MERALRLPRWLFATCGECRAPRGTHNAGCPHAPRVPTPESRVDALEQAMTAVVAAEAALTVARGPFDPTVRRLRKEVTRLEREAAAEASLSRVDAEAF